ncbi:MAG: HlyC/CorC family transporter [Rhodospirillaceae bacterium]|nr:HlyC/CorC family transporter [Rhodospirillaceae bacterium]
MTTETAITIGAIGLLIALSGFFSGSETALTAASRPRMHHLAGAGDRRARAVARLTDDRERLIGAILLGNNAVNILASALATSVLISVVGDAGVAYATIGMTLVILVFAEVLPKTYAIRDADRVALRVAPMLGPIVWLLSPIVGAVRLVVSATLSAAGASQGPRTASAAEEELRGTITLQAQEGAMVKHERDMLHSILDLDEVDVGAVMTHRKTMEMVDAEASPSNILNQVVRSPYTRLPVWKGEPDNIVGVLNAKDLLRAVHENLADLDRLDVMAIVTEPWFVPETTPLEEQLDAFRERRAHFALIVDEYGSLMGLVTLEDIIEEIVGEIVDEHDVARGGVVERADGSLLIPGTVAIRDLNRAYDWDLPDEEAATIAGLVLNEAQEIPEIGDSFSLYGFTFEVRARKRNQITRLRVIPRPHGPARPSG